MDVGKAISLPGEGEAARVRRRRKIRWGDTLAPYLFISPFVVSFVILFVGPAAYSFVLSFFRYKGYGEASFEGLDNYVSLLKYPTFWVELQNTVFYWLIHVLPMMVFAFLLAVLVRSKMVRWKSFYKPVIFLPNIVAVVAASLVFQNFFGTEYGVINNLVGTKIPWLQDMTLARWVVVMLILWRATGWWVVIYLAGLTSINPEIEEAAVVDGASTWQRLRFVTAPLMRNTFLFAFVIDAIGSFRLFTEPNVLVSRGGSLCPPEMAPLLNLLIEGLRNGQFGRASAVGWILFILVVVISYIQFRLLRGTEEAG